MYDRAISWSGVVTSFGLNQATFSHLLSVFMLSSANLQPAVAIHFAAQCYQSARGKLTTHSFLLSGWQNHSELLGRLGLNGRGCSIQQNNSITVLKCSQRCSSKTRFFHSSLEMFNPRYPFDFVWCTVHWLWFYVQAF